MLGLDPQSLQKHPTAEVKDGHNRIISIIKSIEKERLIPIMEFMKLLRGNLNLRLGDAIVNEGENENTHGQFGGSAGEFSREDVEKVIEINQGLQEELAKKAAEIQQLKQALIQANDAKDTLESPTAGSGIDVPGLLARIQWFEELIGNSNLVLPPHLARKFAADLKSSIQCS